MMGIGFIIYVSDVQKFLFKSNLGVRSNNQGELLACFYLLKSLYKKNIHSAQVFGDPSLVINPLKEYIRIKSLSLYTYAQQVTREVEALL